MNSGVLAGVPRPDRGRPGRRGLVGDVEAVAGGADVGAGAAAEAATGDRVPRRAIEGRVHLRASRPRSPGRLHSRRGRRLARPGAASAAASAGRRRRCRRASARNARPFVRDRLEEEVAAPHRRPGRSPACPRPPSRTGCRRPRCRSSSRRAASQARAMTTLPCAARRSRGPRGSRRRREHRRPSRSWPGVRVAGPHAEHHEVPVDARAPRRSRLPSNESSTSRWGKNTRLHREARVRRLSRAADAGRPAERLGEHGAARGDRRGSEEGARLFAHGGSTKAGEVPCIEHERLRGHRSCPSCPAR